MNNKFLYKCISCGKKYPDHDLIYLCPECESKYPKNPPKGILKILYPYEELKNKDYDFSKLIKNNYLDLLPIKSLESLPELQIGNTPLYHQQVRFGDKSTIEIYLKDDSQNPTFSFKDRASAIVSASAEEHDLKIIVTASTGNAGSSMAGICAAQGQKAIVIVPANAPIAKLTQIIMYGATIVPIKGTYDDAFDLSVKASKEYGWYNRNTAYNPLTIEGKKTVSFELFEQLDETIPDNIFVPVGDGVIISGVYKGFEDMLKLGIIENIPKIVAVQADGSDNLVRNLDNKKFEVRSSNTVADSISVDYPRNFYMVRDYLKKYNGEWITVTDDEIIKASGSLAKTTGLFAEPAAAAAYAGIIKCSQSNRIKPNSKNVVLLTGSGLKDIQALKDNLFIPAPIDPDLKSMEKLINY